MSQRENMLSAKRVRLHKLCDARWTAHDKIIQYKGIVKLYKGRKSTGTVALENEAKLLGGELKSLTKKIKLQRESLDSILSGSRQLTENVLVHHKELQLKNRGNAPLKIIESVKQNIFLNRKKMDLLQFKRKELCYKLSDLLLDKAEYESISKERSKLQVEIECGRVTGKVQDRILLTEAAISVRNTYRTIISLLRKDRIYYDQLLLTLKRDQISQSRCLFQMTVLGQLAVEQVDDNRRSFYELKKYVKISLDKRRLDLLHVHDQMKDCPKNMTMIIRRDDDLTTFDLGVDSEFLEVKSSITGVEAVLTFFKDNIFVNNYEKILPCLQDQQVISEKLHKIRDVHLRDVADLTKRIRHAKVQLEQLENEDIYSSFDASCKELEDEIGGLKKKLVELSDREVFIGSKIINVHMGLKSIYCLCKAVKRVQDGNRTTVKISFGGDDVDYPEKAKQMVDVIISKLGLLDSLMRTHGLCLTDDPRIDQYQAYSVLNREFQNDEPTFEVSAEQSEDFEEVRTDNTVLSRNDIKEMSRFLVQKNKEEQLF